jgi:co-chaperonin GroES (HSP10)
MQDKLLSKTRIGQYVENAWTGENLSGVMPIGDQVLILPDKAAEKTIGGIYIAQSTKETQDLAAETGVIVAIGDGAWTWNMDRTRKFEGTKPVIGHRVCFTRYAGMEVIGDDGEMYRIMNDACIGGIRGSAPSESTPLEAA